MCAYRKWHSLSLVLLSPLAPPTGGKSTKSIIASLAITLLLRENKSERERGGGRERERAGLYTGALVHVVDKFE